MAKRLRQPEIESRANAWKAFMLPLHHWRSLQNRRIEHINSYNIYCIIPTIRSLIYHSNALHQTKTLTLYIPFIILITTTFTNIQCYFHLSSSVFVATIHSTMYPIKCLGYLVLSTQTSNSHGTRGAGMI